MRYFNERLATHKSKTMRGTKNLVICEGAKHLTLEKGAGLGVDFLEITGNGDGIFQNGISIRFSGKNLIDKDKFAELVLSYDTVGGAIVERNGRRCIKLYNGKMHGKSFLECIPTLKENTRYIFSFEAMPYTVFAEDEKYDGKLFVGFSPASTEVQQKGLSAKTTHDFTRIYNVNRSGTTVTDIRLSYGSVAYWLIDLDSLYLYEYDGNEDPEYEAPIIKTIKLPQTLSLDGKELALALKDEEALLWENGELFYKTQGEVYKLEDYKGALLDMPYRYGQDIFLSIRSDTAPKSIKAQYYSMELERKANLLVSYLCENEKIKEDATYPLRYGSAYRVIAPLIKGYESIIKEHTGIANGDTEIKIYYRKKE